MIEIENKTSQVVYFPKTMKSTGPYTLKIHSELSQKDWYIDNLLDQANLNDYYKFTVDFTDIDDGEFNYSISKADDTFDTGLIRIGVVQNYGQGYDTDVQIIQYDQYSDPQIRYQHKSISALTNGNYYVTPDEGYVALSEVDIYVNVPSDSGASYESGYTEGYESGYTQGSEDGYGSGYTQGTTDGYGSGYTSGKTDGYNSGYTKGSEDGYDSGWTNGHFSGYTDGYAVGYSSGTTDGYNVGLLAGEEVQKAKLVDTAFTENRIYTRADGWKSVTVNVPQTGHTDEEMQQAYVSGKTDGIAEQKEKLVSTAFTQNGTYTRNDGWSSVVIDVSGYTEQDLLNAFNSGYTNGYTSGKTDGYDSGWTAGYGSGYTDGYESGQTSITGATAITINVPSSITGSGQASVVAEPSTAILDLVYTSSDPNTATIDSNGNITVLSAGTVTITVTDRNSGLFDTQTITVEPAGGLYVPLTVDVLSGGTILWKTDSPVQSLAIEYKINNGEWTSITATSVGTPINVSAGDTVKFRGDNARYGDMYGSYTNHLLLDDGKYDVKGNIMSMIDPVNYAAITSFTEDNTAAFANMFKNSTGIIHANELILPATTLIGYCYMNLFSGCTSLTTAPELPATILADYCYEYMFAGCTSLTTAPELPASSLEYGCYQNMFRACSSLNFIKCLATDISATNCTYNWVNGVASAGTFVKSASMTGWTTGNSSIPTGWVVKNDGPDLTEPLTFNIISSGTIYWKAQDTSYTTTIDYSKDNGSTWSNITSTTAGTSFNVNAGDKVMFRGDNATYSTGYNKMNTFNGSTAIFEVEGNIMSLIDSTGFTTATTLASSLTFYDLFSNCIGLTTAENLVLPATTLTESCYCLMFSGCTSLTTAPALPATTLLNVCYAQMFQGCTSLTTPPELPARNLAFLCYSKMFWGCTSLTTAPELPATILTDSCYVGMFSGCTNLNYIKCLATDITANSCTEKWVEGVQTNSGTFVKDANTTWPTGNSGIPANWTVQDAQ